MQSLLMFLIITLSLLVAFSGSTSRKYVHYVKPKDTPPQDCPGQPCFTLDQYTKRSKTYFVTGATFQFLAGNHTLITTINLTNVSTLTMKGTSGDSNTTVLCEDTVFLCENVNNFTIKALVFELQSSNIYQQFSALRFHSSTEIVISNSIFQGSSRLDETGRRSVFSVNSIITITNCIFDGNVGEHGGALLAVGSNITLVGNAFTRNKANGHGGAIFAVSSSIHLVSEFNYTTNEELDETIAGDMSNGNTTENNSIALFSNNEAGDNGGAIYLSDSNASLSGTVIVFRNNAANDGGGIYIKLQETLSVEVVTNAEHLYFIGNKAVGVFTPGGAINVDVASLTLGETMRNNHYFINNLPAAIYSTFSRVTITGNSFFVNNGHIVYNNTASGGAIRVHESILTLMGIAVFHGNKAKFGGAITVEDSNAVFNGTSIEFKDNTALEGGGLYSTESYLILKPEHLKFVGNNAQERGGAVSIDNTHYRQKTVISGNYIDNIGGECGGAVSVVGNINIIFEDITATGNSESALCITTSNVTFTGYTRITNNTGQFGGGIYSMNSMLRFVDNFEIQNNIALIGGAIYSLFGEVTFKNVLPRDGVALLSYNTAYRDGGALHATGTEITLKRAVHFISNSAQNGGAIYLTTAATLILDRKFGSVLGAAHNRATDSGGVIYYEDATTYAQCNFNRDVEGVRVEQLPNCLFQPSFFRFLPPFTSYMNSARRGEFMYGGLLDRCRLDFSFGNDKNTFIATEYLELHSRSGSTNITGELTSPPYRLCFCESNLKYDCSGDKNFTIQRGQLIKIPLISLDHITNAVSTLVTAVTSPTARLELTQSPQALTQNCSNLTYNIFSTEDSEQLILYPDGPCHDTGLARAIVNVAILPCPDAFTKSTSGEQCVCEERLQVYGADCIINDTIHIRRKVGSNFWMNSLHENGTYQGLVLFKTCPLDYCTKENVNLTLDDLDAQCDHNRSGVLCGECSANYSLLLGSSDCKICSNTYLALLLPFAAAGIALVISLSVLRLTVATGMINSIILYANIIQANRNLFFTSNQKNVLTVFIAWVNLDLGFETCFCHGLDAYTQTWLQFVFPFYVWILISLIIITSRYSITMSKLIGHNPIAVLATLLLMSYTKILKIVIEVYSSVDLDYPDNRKVTVWLKDANVPYRQSKHLLLTVVTSLVLAFFFLPYTLLLLLGHKLYRFTGRKGLRWLNKIKPLLDSYYAPYKKHTRYWTGFLLLVRCGLYIVFSFNSLGATNKSLLSINITFTVIVILAWLSTLIYKNFYVNVIEASIYLNFIVLSAVTLAGANTETLVYSLVGIVFATNIGIITYHFHLFYTAKSPAWLKVRAKITSLVDRIKARTANSTAPIEIPANTSSHDQHRMVSKTVIDLREPLLEN